MCQWRAIEARLDESGPFIHTATGTRMRAVDLGSSEVLRDLLRRQVGHQTLHREADDGAGRHIETTHDSLGPNLLQVLVDVGSHIELCWPR
jgi:hypothetical protein